MENRIIISGRVCLLLFLFIALMTGAVSAQDQSRYFLRPVGEPTGVFADIASLQNAPSDYFQPVKFNVPQGVLVSLAGPQGFVDNEKSNIFGMTPRTVYRFRLSRIPLHGEQELYPTLELVNRLYPPEGEENQFPIQIDITKEDIDLALGGNLVTRVVFLENPENALPIETNMDTKKVSLEVAMGADPVATAEQYGPVMAILRMGSRVPTESPMENPSFYFDLPLFTVDSEK